MGSAPYVDNWYIGFYMPGTKTCFSVKRFKEQGPQGSNPEL